MLDKSVEHYLDMAASRSPAPGGGSVAAVAGALAASMASMVANFTIGKKGYEGFQEEAAAILAQSENCRKKLAILAAEDIAAYRKVSEAYAMPRETPQQKELRKQKISESTREAISVPLETLRYSAMLMPLLVRLADIGNKNLITDVGVSAYLGEASVRSARLNVEINLACLDDKEFIMEKRALTETAVSETARLAAEVTGKVDRTLAKT